MKKITLLISLLISFASFAQKNMSNVDDSTKNAIIHLLISNKSHGDIAGYYKELNYNTRIIRVITAGVVVKHKDTATFSLDLINHLRIQNQDNYLIYNVLDNGSHKLIGQYDANDTTLGAQMTVPAAYREKYLDEVAQYYNIYDVDLLFIFGIGTCVKVNNEIWIIDGDTRTDLNTSVKEEYHIRRI